MKSFFVLLAFVAICFAASPKAPKESKEIRAKIMSFNYEVDEFLDKLRYEKEELLDGQHKNHKYVAKKFIDCVSKEEGLFDSVRHVVTKAYKTIITNELEKPFHAEFCKENSTARNVFQKLKKCVKSNKKSTFSKDLRSLIEGAEREICTPHYLRHKLAVLERFRGESDSSHSKKAFERYQELLKDCTKLKEEDQCLPFKLARAFEDEAIRSHIFSPDSLKLYASLVRIYYTAAIKAPYKDFAECEKEIMNPFPVDEN